MSALAWEPIPQARWADRVRLCRQRGQDHGYAQPGQPLSDYEPCEVCGTRIVALELPDCGRGMVELTALQGDPARSSSRLKLDGRWHRCRGRRTAS